MLVDHICPEGQWCNTQHDSPAYLCDRLLEHLDMLGFPFCNHTMVTRDYSGSH